MEKNQQIIKITKIEEKIHEFDHPYWFSPLFWNFKIPITLTPLQTRIRYPNSVMVVFFVCQTSHLSTFPSVTVVFFVCHHSVLDTFHTLIVVCISCHASDLDTFQYGMVVFFATRAASDHERTKGSERAWCRRRRTRALRVRKRCSHYL